MNMVGGMVHANGDWPQFGIYGREQHHPKSQRCIPPTPPNISFF